MNGSVVRSRSRAWLLTLVALVSIASPLAAQEAVDPKSLIGEWQGRWRNLATAGPAYGATGQYELKITSAGDKVVGRYFSNIGGRDSEGPFTGTLQGNKLTFGRAEFTVSDNKMQGTWRTDSNRWAIELMKK